MKLSLLFLPIIMILFIGCSNDQEKINKTVKLDEKPRYQVPAQIEPPKKKAKGSLFSGGTSSLFTDRKALQIGDIVYITVKEGPAKAETKSEKTTTVNDAERTQSGGSVNAENSFGIIKEAASLLNKIVGVGFTIPSRSSSFSATAESTTEDVLEYDISAVITQQYQNGNYLIEGLKYVVISGQKHTLKISGVMNPQELTGSTITSNKLANLKVVYFKEGDEQEYMDKPWGTKLLETISPF